MLPTGLVAEYAEQLGPGSTLTSINGQPVEELGRNECMAALSEAMASRPLTLGFTHRRASRSATPQVPS